MKLKALVNFSWAHHGYDIKEYEVGEIIETEDEDLISVSTTEGWAEETDETSDDADLSKMNKDKLLEIAGELGLEVSAANKKAEIIAAIEAARNEA